MTASASVVAVDRVMEVLNFWFDGSMRVDRNSEMVAQLAALLPRPAEQDAREAVAWRYRDKGRADGWKFSSTPVYLDPEWGIECEPLYAAPTQAAPDGWRPIETAPRDGTPVDLLIEGERWPEYSWSEKRNAWTKEVGYPTRTSVIMTKPTHYFVVPAPPAQGAGG